MLRRMVAEQRRGVACTGKSHAALSQIQIDVAGRGKHGDVGAVEYPVELSIEAGEQKPGSISQIGNLFHETTQHGGDECRTHAMPHHIADEHADAGITHRENLKAIAGHPCGGHVDMMERGAANLSVLLLPYSVRDVKRLQDSLNFSRQRDFFSSARLRSSSCLAMRWYFCWDSMSLVTSDEMPTTPLTEPSAAYQGNLDTLRPRVLTAFPCLMVNPIGNRLPGAHDFLLLPAGDFAHFRGEEMGVLAADEVGRVFTRIFRAVASLAMTKRDSRFL